MVRDTFGDVSLYGEDVLYFPVVAVGPEVLVSCRVYQLDRDAQLVAGFPDASLQDCPDAEISRDVLDLSRVFLVLHDRGSRDDF